MFGAHHQPASVIKGWVKNGSPVYSKRVEDYIKIAEKHFQAIYATYGDDVTSEIYGNGWKHIDRDLPFYVPVHGKFGNEKPDKWWECRVEEQFTA